MVPTHTKTPFAPHKEEQNEHPQQRGSIIPRPSESANAGTRQFCLRLQLPKYYSAQLIQRGAQTNHDPRRGGVARRSGSLSPPWMMGTTPSRRLVAPAILTLFLSSCSPLFDGRPSRTRGLTDEVNGVAPWAVDVLLGLMLRC